MNPFGSSSSSKEKGEYPPHIPVVKSKTSRAFKDVQVFHIFILHINTNTHA